MALIEWRPEHLRFAIDSASVALWNWDTETDALTMDNLGFELWGLPAADQVSFEELSQHIHPADRDRVQAAFKATNSVSGTYETDFRIMLGDEIRWVSSRGRGADEGVKEGCKWGVFIDVTQRKQNEEANELLAGEMSHRVHNLLAIATSLTSMTSRSAGSVDDMASQLVHRLTALGRVHSLVRPLPGGEGKAALLGDLISVILAPYDDEGAFAGRIKISVPRMGIGELSATALAMIIHELATNSLKYGALSVTTGNLDISSTSDDDEVELVWSETGGPAIVDSPVGMGFGSRMLRNSVERQLRGTMAMDWQEAGLVAKIRVKRPQLTK